MQTKRLLICIIPMVPWLREINISRNSSRFWFYPNSKPEITASHIVWISKQEQKQNLRDK